MRKESQCVTTQSQLNTRESSNGGNEGQKKAISTQNK